MVNILFANIQNKKYSISVCTTSTLEHAITCKERIQKSFVDDVIFIVKEKENRFITYLGLFDTSAQANQSIKNSSTYVKQQGPFYKEIKEDIVNLTNLDLSYIDINKDIYFENSITKETIKTPVTHSQNIDFTETMDDLLEFEEILIEVNSKTNLMNVKAKKNDEFTILKTYSVSTGKNSVKKPKGLGKISEITLNPTWYPTQDTLKSFRKRGIYLPSAVPGGDKLNYMGAAKLNLTHIVDGMQTFRIHGTLNEHTIGTNESAGCIRMKNNEIVELANLLKDFSKHKSMNNISVKLD